MYLGESIRITDWFYITFIENNGMAYGMTFINKYILSSLRIVIAVGAVYYLIKMIKQACRTRFIIFISMIIAGAFGNIIDSLLYGLIFTESTPFSVSSLVSFGEGYSHILLGKVVDMFYFPLIVTHYPEWFPIKGGEEFIFFSPVFNVADAAISVGFVCLLLFCRHDLSMLSHKQSDNTDTI